MEDLRRDSGVSLTPFFDRCKLPPSVKDDCDTFVRARYPEPIRPAPFQGYCSYTLFVGEDTIVQFRPLAHKLDINMTTIACQVFGRIAPKTEFIGQLDPTELYAFSMRRLPGVSLSDIRAQTGDRNATQITEQRKQIVRDFAHLQAKAWVHGKSVKVPPEKGKVGSSLQWRLELMHEALPKRFRRVTGSLLAALPKIEALPWTFSHGDLLPSNIMVCPESGKLLGLLDWAEAEFLPFGVGMYGLEELLGEDRGGRFVYYPEAKHLRRLFWRQLLLALPELAQDARLVTLVKKAQTLGILLWHGIAFDDGKLNRAVEEGKDNEEIEKLDVFLSSSVKSRRQRLRDLGPLIVSPVSFIQCFLRGKT
ncbi:hypothetical protein F5X96DRAFT_626569 [Biscogniauxia mediterranea]|nr:hypothetical protein F5X96DRAFT_626569 [Biscogniauxia mediterranea]